MRNCLSTYVHSWKLQKKIHSTPFSPVGSTGAIDTLFRTAFVCWAMSPNSCNNLWRCETQSCRNESLSKTTKICSLPNKKTKRMCTSQKKNNQPKFWNKTSWEIPKTSHLTVPSSAFHITYATRPPHRHLPLPPSSGSIPTLVARWRQRSELCCNSTMAGGTCRVGTPRVGKSLPNRSEHKLPKQNVFKNNKKLEVIKFYHHFFPPNAK